MSNRKNVLVSGASSGIGKATAIRFANEGWDVCLTARREKELMAVKESLPPGNHLVCPGDYSDPAVAQAIRDVIQSKWGKLDVLVNCAGVFLAAHAIDAPLEKWRKPFDLMVNGAVYLTRMAVPLMTGGGRIIRV